MVILNVILETARLNNKVFFFGSVGSKISPNGERPVMAATSKSVGVSIPMAVGRCWSNPHRST